MNWIRFNIFYAKNYFGAFMLYLHSMRKIHFNVYKTNVFIQGGSKKSKLLYYVNSLLILSHPVYGEFIYSAVVSF